ncbi:A/G-specific adenine glycosylase [Salipaludibacillus keqinensis]|uniref:Adenine DNA glycosylase n=1 Tax=Salipaludibacillus keqinensis TaxID=2045207 RepID=A0A323TID5_9BACI|nr:A/G-specific adenine glycosylase [Salipaludibacillus keqinensis]PYZ92413.1 A/G-specific adenine glycosylase [Salipaludibacillus keqinensis]
MKTKDNHKFQQDLLAWYDENKRDLPWRKERDPYKIWVSEIMLQQTRVDTVIPYFQRFMDLFPTIHDLAEAEEETVLKAWEGLGYYSRARNLHQAVKEVSQSYGGQVPKTEKEIGDLKGVGPYTAGAILSIAYNIPAPAVDGNVMRVLSRIYTIYDDISKASTRKTFESIVRELISQDRSSDFNQALMELGAMVCSPTNPSCLLCPVQNHCSAKAEGVQDVLPVKAKKKPPKKLKMKAVILRDHDGRILIERRPDTGLLAKLWQFPNIEAETENLDDLTAYITTLGLKADITNKVQEVKHVFSHIVWEISVYEAIVKAGHSDELYDETLGRHFVQVEDVNWYPFPVSHQKIIDGALVKKEDL